MGKPHRSCHKDCKYYGVLSKLNIRIETADTMSVMLQRQESNSSALGGSLCTPSKTPSTSSTSRKCLREPTPEEDLEECLRREKAQQRKTIQCLKIYYVLDPTRALESYVDTEDDVCQLDTELPGGEEEIKRLLGSGELEGYVSQHPKHADLVRMNDWVSHAILPTSLWLTSYMTNPGVHWIFLSLAGRIYHQVQELEGIWKTPDWIYSTFCSNIAGEARVQLHLWGY